MLSQHSLSRFSNGIHTDMDNNRLTLGFMKYDLNSAREKT